MSWLMFAQTYIALVSTNISLVYGNNVVEISKIPLDACSGEFKTYPDVTSANAYDVTLEWVSPFNVAPVILPLIDCNVQSGLNSPHEHVRHATKSVDTYPVVDASMNFNLCWNLFRKDSKFVNDESYWSKLKKAGFNPSLVNIKYRSIDMQNVYTTLAHYAVKYMTNYTPQLLWSFLEWVTMIIAANVSPITRATSCFGPLSRTLPFHLPFDPFTGLPADNPMYVPTSCKKVRMPYILSQLVSKIRCNFRSHNSYIVPFTFNQPNMITYGTFPLWYAIPNAGAAAPSTGPVNPNNNTPRGLWSMHISPLGGVSYFTDATDNPGIPPGSYLNVVPLSIFSEVNRDVQNMFTSQFGNWYSTGPKNLFHRCAAIYSQYVFTTLFADFGGGVNVSGGSSTVAMASDEPVSHAACTSEAAFRTFLVIANPIPLSSDLNGTFSGATNTDKSIPSSTMMDSSTLEPGSTNAQHIANSKEPSQAIAAAVISADASIDPPPQIKSNPAGVVGMVNHLKTIGHGPEKDEGKSATTVVPAIVPQNLTSLANVAGNISTKLPEVAKVAQNGYNLVRNVGKYVPKAVKDVSAFAI